MSTKSKVNIRDPQVEEEEEVQDEVVNEAAEHQTKVSIKFEGQIPKRKLHRDEAGVRLQMVGKTAEGDSYAYLKIICTDMGLTDISVIATFEYVMFVNVSNNYLTLEDLQILMTMPSLILLHADNNLIITPYLKRAEYLQVIIMNFNRITSIKEFYQPNISTLELANNELIETEFDYGHHMLGMKYLDLRNNYIKEIYPMQFKNLMALYLAGNKITNTEGIYCLSNLKILHLRNNPIKKLNGFNCDLVKLQYINLRNCPIRSLWQVKKLKVLPSIKELILKGTILMGGTGKEDKETEDGEEEDDADKRIEILASVPRLERINKTSVTPEERAEAMEMLKAWIEVGIEEEEEEEIEAEQEAAQQD